MNNGLLYRLLRWCPGALGLLLRQKIYPLLLGSCGKKVLFGRFIDFINPEQIHIGNRAVINNHVLLAAGNCPQRTGNITIADDVFIGFGTTLTAGPGTISIGSGTNISSQCKIVAKHPVIIGNDILLAAYCNIGGLTEDHQKGCKDHITDIGNGAWLGVRMSIKDGITVGKEAIIGAHSLVNTDVDSYVIAFGSPVVAWRYRQNLTTKTH